MQLAKLAILGLSLFTGLMAVLVLGHLITSPSGTVAWIATRFAGALFVAVGAVASWLLLLRERAGLRTPTFAIATGLVAIGAASLVNAYHWTLTSGDAEYWVILLNGAVLAQGMGTLGYLWWSYALGGPEASRGGET